MNSKTVMISIPVLLLRFSSNSTENFSLENNLRQAAPI